MMNHYDEFLELKINVGSEQLLLLLEISILFKILTHKI